MLGIFKKNPLKKLQKDYEKTMQEALSAQRNGNIDLYAKLSSKADKIRIEIERLEKAQD